MPSPNPWMLDRLSSSEWILALFLCPKLQRCTVSGVWEPETVISQPWQNCNAHTRPGT